MPTTANSITYYVAADGTLRDGPQGSISQQPRINYGTNYAVTLSFPASTIAEGDQLQVALNRTRTFFSSASATGDAPVAAVSKHDVTAEEAAAQEVAVVLSTNTRAMIDQVNGIDHPVRGFFGVHVLRGQSFVTLAVADALMMSLESGPDAISPSLPVVDYPTREEAEALAERSETAAGRAETAQGKAEEAQGKAETAEDNAQIWAEGTDQQVEELGGGHSAKEYGRQAGVFATNAEQSATDAENAQGAAETAQTNAGKIAEGSDADVAPLGLEHSAKGWAQVAAATLASKRDILQTLVTSSSTALVAEAGKSYNWTVSAPSTIALAAADRVAGKETRIDIYIDLQDGGSVTGDGVTISDAVLQSGWYKLIWDGTNATLYSTKAGGAEAVITIPSSSTAYTLQDNKHYQQVPDAVPTYTLPTASFDGLVHEITVLVDFMHVTSCSFVDAGGVPVTLQSAISPQIGEAYVFRCYWYGKWRVVPLKIRNAATASSSNGVVEITDAVAGDALALKMTAPRSVVVNQLVQNGNFADGTTGWTLAGSTTWSCTVSDGVLTAIRTGTQDALPLYQYPITAFRGHTVIARFEYRLRPQGILLSGNQNHIGYFGSPTVWINASDVTPNKWISVDKKVALSDTANGLYIGPYAYNNSLYWNGQIGDEIDIRNVQLVDLTQYFNGDATLIASITSWDDLVAYDPRFANYVEHNTGTVEGVQPQVKVIGKNLFDKTQTLTIGYLSDAGSIVSSDVVWVVTDYISVIPGSVITATYPIQAGVGASLCFYTQDKVYISGVKHQGAVNQIKTYNVPLNAYYIRDSFYRNQENGFQLELGSSATSYEPYHDGGTAQAPAPLFAVGTAADEFEAVSGVTTHKMASYTFTGNETWVESTVYPGSYFNTTIITNAVRGNIIPKAIMPGYINETTSTSSNANMSFSLNSTSHSDNSFGIRDFSVSNGTELASKLAGNTIYYKLATPTTSQSTPTQISLQAGANIVTQTDGGRTLAGLAMTYENLPSAN